VKSLRYRAVDLRKRGWSYNIISQRLGLSKSTLSDWLREVPYTPNRTVIRRIRAGPAQAAVSKQRKRLSEILALKKDGLRQIGHISKRDLLFLGIGLYMGEGSKLYETTRVINSDPRIVQLAVEWFMKVCKVPMRNFAAVIHIYPDISERQAVAYWARIIGIPRSQFEKVQVDRRLTKSFKKQRILPYGTVHYGTVHLKVYSRGNTRFGVTLHRRIIGWIEAVYNRSRV